MDKKDKPDEKQLDDALKRLIDILGSKLTDTDQGDPIKKRSYVDPTMVGNSPDNFWGDLYGIDMANHERLYDDIKRYIERIYDEEITFSAMGRRAVYEFQDTAPEGLIFYVIFNILDKKQKEIMRQRGEINGAANENDETDD